MEFLKPSLGNLTLTLKWLGACILVIVFIEAGYSGYRSVFGHDRVGVPERLIRSSVLNDKPWAEAMFKEQFAAGMEYHAYLGWRSLPFKGMYVNVSSEGIRRTFPASCNAMANRDSVFVFGGSSIWGVCVRDEHTVPSCLAEHLCREGNTSTVVNYGEKGFSFTQGVLSLILLLRSGHRPSQVIFVDGANDILAAYLAGKVGVEQLDGELQGLVDFKRLSHIRQVASVAEDWVEHSSVIWKILTRLRTMVLPHVGPNPLSMRYKKEDLAGLSVAIEQNYLASYRLLGNMSRLYGFTYHCFLQPLAYTKVHLTDEDLQGDYVDNADLRSLSLETYALLQRDSLQGLHSLADVLDTCNTTCYFDFCHVSEDANGIIADRILALLPPRETTR